MNKIEKILLYTILVMFLVITILLTNKLIKIYERYDKLEERINNVAISNRLYYEDILELIERK